MTTYRRTTYRIVQTTMTLGVGLGWVGSEWIAARLACPCRYEEGKEECQLPERYILPAKQPIRRRVFESFLNGSPMTSCILCLWLNPRLYPNVHTSPHLQTRGLYGREVRESGGLSIGQSSSAQEPSRGLPADS